MPWWGTRPGCCMGDMPTPSARGGGAPIPMGWPGPTGGGDICTSCIPPGPGCMAERWGEW